LTFVQSSASSMLGDVNKEEKMAEKSALRRAGRIMACRSNPTAGALVRSKKGEKWSFRAAEVCWLLASVLPKFVSTEQFASTNRRGGSH